MSIAPDTWDDLERAAERASIGCAELRELLQALVDQPRWQPADLAERSGVALSAWRAFQPEIASWLVGEERGFVVTDVGRAAALAALEQAAKAGRPDEDRLLRLLREVAANRPPRNRNLDQLPATPETLAARVLLMHESCDLRGKRVLFLGDYDLTSVAAALVGGATAIAALDLDHRVLTTIRGELARLSSSGEEVADVECHFADLRAGLPAPLRRSADVVFADPPYTPDGAALFASRAIAAFRNERSRLYFCYGTSARAKERALKAQEVITKAGLALHRVMPAFNQYEGAAALGSRSSLYVCDATEQSKALVSPGWSGAMYTGKRRTPTSAEQGLRVTKELARRALALLDAQPDDQIVTVGLDPGQFARELPRDAELRAAPFEAFAVPGRLKRVYSASTHIITHLPEAACEPALLELHHCGAKRVVALTDLTEQTRRGRDGSPPSHLGLFLNGLFVATPEPGAAPQSGGDAAGLSLLQLTPRAPEQRAEEPLVYLLCEVLLQDDKLVANATREALIRYAELRGGPSTKREARAVVADAVPEALREVKVEALSSTDLRSLARGLEAVAGKIR